MSCVSSVDKKHRLLGRGGFSARVERCCQAAVTTKTPVSSLTVLKRSSRITERCCCRWYDTDTKEWVAAKYVSHFDLAQHEATMLALANKSEVSRVLRFKNDIIQTSEHYIVMLE